MNLQVVQPLFNADEARFLSNNQKLFEELTSDLDAEILSIEKTTETTIHYSVELANRNAAIDLRDFHIENAKRALVQALSTLYAKRGYEVYHVTTSQFSIDWRGARAGTVAEMSRKRTLEWKNLYEQLDSIKLDVLAVATSPENQTENEDKNKVFASVPYRPILNKAEQADHIKVLLDGYQSAGYEVFEMATEDRHEITIAW